MKSDIDGLDPVIIYKDIEGGEKIKMKYSVHRFDINMTKDQSRLEQFLNRLEGEVVSIIPNIRPKFLPMGATAVLDFLYIVEKVN